MKSSFLRYCIFLLLLIGICYLLGYPKYIYYRPQSIHQWAQCDRASVAFNYFTNGFHFFTPQVHNISNGTGFTGLEFPIINFLAAIGYLLFGFHEYIYRFIVLGLLLFGLLNAYRLADLLLPGKIIAALPVCLIFVSPVLAYYCISFLPDAAALGLSLASWFYFFKWHKNQSKPALIITIVLCSFAGLIKVSAMMNPVAMAAFIVLNNGQPELKTLVRQKIIHSLLFLLPVIPVFAWYYYANQLNKTYESKIFMLEMRPVGSWEEFKSIWKEIEHTWFWSFYPRIYFIALSVASVVAAFVRQKADRTLLTITLLLYVGAVSFFFLMYTQFRVHDYYIIALMPAFFFHWLLIIKKLTGTSKSFTIVTTILLLGLTSFVTVEAKHHLREAHDKASWKYSPVVYDLYFYLEPELRKLNIQPGDPVLSLYDWSFNVSLYLMNQVGNTVGPKTPVKDILKELQKPVYKYAILNNFNPTRFDSVMDSLNLGKKILDWNDLTVYTLHANRK